MIRGFKDGAGEGEREAAEGKAEKSRGSELPLDAVREGGSVSEAPAAVSPAAVRPPASPRTILREQLTAGMSAALAVGDLEVARIAHDATGRLLGIATAGAAAPVLDLAVEHGRRT